MGPIAAVIGAVSSVVGTIGAVQSAAAQRRAVDLQEKQQKVATRRSRRQAIRQAQIARANAISAGATLGGLFGSSLQGGLSSLGSQLGGELGFSTQMSGLSKDISSAQRSAARWGAISQLGFGLFNALGGFQGIASGFAQGRATRNPTASGTGGIVSRPFAPGGAFAGGGGNVRPAIYGGPNTRPGTYSPIYAPVASGYETPMYGPQ